MHSCETGSSASRSLRRSVRLTVHALVVAVLGLAAPGALAQKLYDDAPLPDRFAIRIGAFLIDDFDTTFSLTSAQVPIGTVIRLEDSLGVDSSLTVARIEGGYRFGKKGRIDFGWFSTNRDGFNEVMQDITIADPDTGEEIVIMAGASVSTQWDFDLFNVTYAHSFVNTWRYELFIGVGLNIRNLKIQLDGDFDLDGMTDSTDSVEASGVLPLPTVVLGGRFNFSKKWRADLRLQWFRLELGDYKGAALDNLLAFEHNTFRNVGFGFGLNGYQLDVEAEGSDFTGTLDATYSGFLAYVKLYTGGRH